MPFDSNGTFNRVIPGGWKADALAGIKIRADRHDDEDDGFATGLSTCLTKDGRTQPTANLPMNNKKLTNLGEPDNPNDAATKNYVDNFKSFTTGATIAGAGPINGFLTFASPTGVNGIGWATADMSWIGRLGEAGKNVKVLAINDAVDGTGTDVVFFDESGRMNNTGSWSNNLSYESGTRTITAGYATSIVMVNGLIQFKSNQTPTTVAYQNATLRDFANFHHADGSSLMSLNKSGSTKVCETQIQTNGSMRWKFEWSSGTAETGAWAGSDFTIWQYSNDGASVRPSMNIIRNTNAATFFGNLSALGEVHSAQAFQSDSSNCILGAMGGGIYFRPNGVWNGANQAILDSSGSLSITGSGGVWGNVGYRTHTGTAGGYGGNWFNIYWSSPYVQIYIDNTYMGAIQWQSDYRFKKGIKALPGMWDKVKALNPVRYSIKKWGLFESDDTERWGFLAHEMQEKLTKNAATGSKDEDNVVQQIDPMTIVAALTKALQEAMARIEALEARA